MMSGSPLAAQIGFQVANLSKNNYKSVAKELFEVLVSLKRLLLGSRQTKSICPWIGISFRVFVANFGSYLHR